MKFHFVFYNNIVICKFSDKIVVTQRMFLYTVDSSSVRRILNGFNVINLFYSSMIFGIIVILFHLLHE